MTPPPSGRTPVESPVAGLRRRRLTLTQVLAQSVASVAPSAAMVTLPAVVIAGVGSAAVVCFAVASVIVVGVGYCLSHFARRMASASGLYSYTAKGLGPVAAFTAGWALMSGYLLVAIASVLGSALYLSSLIDLSGLVPADSSIPMGATIIVLAALAGLLMVRGIKLSARVSLGLELISVVLIVAVLIVLMIKHASVDSPAPAVTGPLTVGAVALGVLLAVTSFVGFESAGTLGVEAKRPLVTIARAVRWIPLALGGLYLIAVATQVVNLADAPLEVLRSPTPVADLTRLRGNTALSVMVDLGVAASFFACVIGSGNACARIIFSMGREGMLPRVLGRTHRRYETPHMAILLLLPLFIFVPILMDVAGTSRRDALVALLTISAFGYLVSYAFVCIETPAFLWRIRELTTRPLAAGIITSIVMVALLGWVLVETLLTEPTIPVAFLAVMLMGWLLLGAVWLRDRARLQRIGVYDETLADDLFIGTQRVWTR